MKTYTDMKTYYLIPVGTDEIVPVRLERRKYLPGCFGKSRISDLRLVEDPVFVDAAGNEYRDGGYYYATDDRAKAEAALANVLETI